MPGFYLEYSCKFVPPIMGTRLARILEVIARKFIKTKKMVHLDNNNPLERRD